MTAVASLVYSIVCYMIFLATFVYLIAFTGNLPFVPATVDRGPDSPLWSALAIDTALILAFGLQHSVMARRGFKRWWTRIVPSHAERSTYVLLASAILIVLFLGWRPIEITIWSVEQPWASAAIWTVFGLGWAIVLLSTFLINHFELFGLQQAWHHARNRAAATPVLRAPSLYKVVRHPLYLGFFLAFWATPHMSAGHLLLTVGLSAYMLVAIAYEERDLIDLFGDDYRDYRARVGMLIPGIGKRST